MVAGNERSVPAEIVDRFLQLWEDRDDAGAGRFFAEDPVIVFPGPLRLVSLAEVRAMGARYRWVRKHRDDYATAHLPDGRVQVTSRGRLYGVNLFNVEFEDVRYVDVFILRDGLIQEQHVWNVLAGYT